MGGGWGRGRGDAWHTKIPLRCGGPGAEGVGRQVGRGWPRPRGEEGNMVDRLELVEAIGNSATADDAVTLVTRQVATWRQYCTDAAVGIEVRVLRDELARAWESGVAVAPDTEGPMLRAAIRECDREIA